jgi:hypothetical protein
MSRDITLYLTYFLTYRRNPSCYFPRYLELRKELESHYLSESNANLTSVARMLRMRRPSTSSDVWRSSTLINEPRQQICSTNSFKEMIASLHVTKPRIALPLWRVHPTLPAAPVWTLQLWMGFAVRPQKQRIRQWNHKGQCSKASRPSTWEHRSTKTASTSRHVPSRQY